MNNYQKLIKQLHNKLLRLAQLEATAIDPRPADKSIADLLDESENIFLSDNSELNWLKLNLALDAEELIEYFPFKFTNKGVMNKIQEADVEVFFLRTLKQISYTPFLNEMFVPSKARMYESLQEKPDSIVIQKIREGASHHLPLARVEQDPAFYELVSNGVKDNFYSKTVSIMPKEISGSVSNIMKYIRSAKELNTATLEEDLNRVEKYIRSPQIETNIKI